MDNDVYHLFIITAHKHRVLTQEMWRIEGIPCSPRSLCEIADNEGITQKELSKLLSIKPASVTTTIDKLEATGCIYRKSDENDLRIKRIYLTEKGRKAIEKAEELKLKIYKTAFGNFTVEEKAVFKNLLSKLEKNLEEYKNEEAF